MAVGYAVSGIELVVSFEVADDLLRGTRHCRDAGGGQDRRGRGDGAVLGRIFDELSKLFVEEGLPAL